MVQSSEKPVLLLISDNASILHWMRKNLQERHYLLETSSEEKAVEIVRATKLDFIVIDSSLETCDPLTLCRTFRAYNTITPILLITGRLKKTYRDEALESGVSDFLSDQLDLDELETRFATGKKAAAERKKAALLSEKIKAHSTQKELSRTYFRSKVVLNEQALKLLAHAKEIKTAVALLTLRIDHFGQIETEQGIVAAEKIQHDLAETLQSSLQPDDLLIPFSNGRFILLLHINPETARFFAEQLRNRVEREPFHIHGKTVHVSISIAIAKPCYGDEEYNRMVAHAVQALKQAESMANLILSLDKETT